MAKYSFKVVDSTGKSQKKTVEAKSEEAARVKLKSEGYSVAGVGKEVGGGKKKGGKVTDRDLSVFCKQFAAVLRAGVPIISALDMMGEQMTNTTPTIVMTSARFGCPSIHFISRPIRKMTTIDSLMPTITS